MARYKFHHRVVDVIFLNVAPEKNWIRLCNNASIQPKKHKFSSCSEERGWNRFTVVLSTVGMIIYFIKDPTKNWICRYIYTGMLHMKRGSAMFQTVAIHERETKATGRVG